MEQTSIRKLTSASVFAALIFLFTFTVKVPNVSGYTHIGDAFIFLGIFLLDWKYAALAAGVGATLADLAGGYPIWAGPTFLIKSLMVLIAWLFMDKVFRKKPAGTLPALILAGAFQVLGYFVASVLLFDRAYAVASVPGNSIQTAVGIAVALVIVAALRPGNQLEKLRTLASGKKT